MRFEALLIAVGVALPPTALANIQDHRRQPGHSEAGDRPLVGGAVTDREGRPIAGAAIALDGCNRDPKEPTPVVLTDIRGRFLVTSPVTACRDLVVTKAGFISLRIPLHHRQSPLSLTLAREDTVEGRVKASDGTAIRAAVVVLKNRGPTGQADVSAASTTTDQCGRFELPSIRDGLWGVVVKAPGYRTESVRGIRPGVPVTITMRPGGWLQGTVVDTRDRPVAGTLVRVWSRAPRPQLMEEVQADARGEFHLIGAPTGRYFAMASNGRLAVLFELEVPDTGMSELRVRLLPPINAHGRFASASGAPLAGAVTAITWAGEDLPDAISTVVRSDSSRSGQFALELPAAGSWSVLFEAKHHLPRKLDVLVAEGKRAVDLGDITLDTGRTVTGLVRTPSQVGIAGARITAVPENLMIEGAPTSAYADSVGFYRLTGLGPGPHGLRAEASGFAPEVVRLRDVEEVDFVLLPAGTMTGVVVDSRDSPVSPFYVTAERKGPDGGATSAPQYTDALDGRFTIDQMVPGLYDLHVVAPGHVPRRLPDVGIRSAETTDIGLVRVATGRKVRGLVRQPGDEPVLDALVVLQGSSLEGSSGTDAYTTRTDPNGSFVISGVPPGSLSLTVAHPDFARVDLALAVDRDEDPPLTEVVLTRGGRIEGSAHRSDGTPMTGFGVGVLDRSGRSLADATTASDGRFWLDHLPPGRASVTLFSRSRRGLQTSLVSQAVDVSEGAVSPVEFVVSEILLSGRVLQDGLPLQRVELRLWNAEGTTTAFDWGLISSRPVVASGLEHMHAITDELGSFALIVDRPGKYVMQLSRVDGSVEFPHQLLDVPDVTSHVVEIRIPETNRQ